MYTAVIVMFEGSSRTTSDIVKGNLRVKLYPSLLVESLFSYVSHFTFTLGILRYVMKKLIIMSGK